MSYVLRWADHQTRDPSPGVRRRGQPDHVEVYQDRMISADVDPDMRAAQESMAKEIASVGKRRRQRPSVTREQALERIDADGAGNLAHREYGRITHRRVLGISSSRVRYGARVYYRSEGGEVLAMEVGDLTEGPAMALRDTHGTGAIRRAIEGVIRFVAAVRCIEIDPVIGRATSGAKRGTVSFVAPWAAERFHRDRDREPPWAGTATRSPAHYHDVSERHAWAASRGALPPSDAVDCEIWIDTGRLPGHWEQAAKDGYRIPPRWASARLVPLLTDPAIEITAQEDAA